jgi:tetratricopeptide (TPR) repeat protein
MAKWTAFPHAAAAYTYDLAALKKKWARLHVGDAEPLPKDESVLAAWALFHAGQFQKATEAGLKAHAAGAGAGMTVANKAQAIYATYLESSEKTKLALLYEVAERAEARTKEDPKDANAWYCMAYALGRYSQGISIAKALSQGLGAKVKNALETTIKLSPKHADAHTALGSFHAEIIDKVGSLLGRTQGASKDAGLANYKTALKLNPGRRSPWSSMRTGW